MNANRLAVPLFLLMGLGFLAPCQSSAATATTAPTALAAATEAAPATATPAPPPTATLVPEATATPEAAATATAAVVVTPMMPTATAMSQIRILFIGGSFTSGINVHVAAMAASADPPRIIEVAEIAHGGLSLWGHWFSPFGESPEGLPFLPTDMIDDVDLGAEWPAVDEVAAFLQRIAWQTVVEFQADRN